MRIVKALAAGGPARRVAWSAAYSHALMSRDEEWLALVFK